MKFKNTLLKFNRSIPFYHLPNKMKYYTLNAFAKTKEGGNPAGVVFDADNLSSQTRQEIATKIGFSETAFVEKSDKANFKVTFFTPNGEVDLCGHATIATFFLMLKLNRIQIGKYTQETKAGVLSIEATKDEIIFMNQNLPEFFEKIDKNEIADSLNISPDIISIDLPIQIVSTGLKDIFIPIKNLKSLFGIQPNFEKVAYISKKYGTIGYHMFTLETMKNATAHCRNLAPLYDIPEEPATGTSSGALSCYLYKYGKISNKQVGNLVFEQGYSMNKPSEILAQLKINCNEITEVKVGGIASNIQEQVMELKE